MSSYQDLDFTSARQEALAYLSRFFTVFRKSDSDHSPSDSESWTIELEIDRPDGVMCIDVTVELKADFPLSLPDIWLDKEDVVRLDFPPNVSTTGKICTFDPNTSIPNPQAPGRLLEVCVRQAKRVIEVGLTDGDSDRYQAEFIAYWENSYGEEEPVNTWVLSLVEETGTPPSRVNWVLFEEPLGRFSSLVYADESQFRLIQDYLDRQGIGYQDTRTLYLGELGNLSPPFCMRNRDAIDLIERVGLSSEFEEYLKDEPALPLVTFVRVIDERNLVLGWCHRPVEVETTRRGRKLRKHERKLSPKQYPRLLDPRNSLTFVNRVSPQVFTRSRLVNRTAADYAGAHAGGDMSVLIAGLGSVGSSLVPFLESTGVSKFHFVDPDVLRVENIGRHLLGLDDVGKNKAGAMADHVSRRNPLMAVQVRDSRIVPVILKEPTFLSDCDVYFFCTGDVNSETWIAHNLRRSDWCGPAFFIWVEPYLAGGHCVYLSETNDVSWDTLFTDNKFTHNVISNEVHDRVSFAQREAGCQVTFRPYSGFNLHLFLASLFPRIVNLLGTRSTSRCFSWIGDLAALQTMDIEVADYAKQAGPLSLVERPIC